MGKLATRLQEAVNYLDDYLKDRTKALDHEKADAVKQIACVQKVILKDCVRALEREKADGIQQIAVIQKLLERIQARSQAVVHVRSARHR